MRVASVENPAAQAPLAAKLYFDCHDALRAERSGLESADQVFVQPPSPPNLRFGIRSTSIQVRHPTS
jgi:hypothetical protein